MELFDKLYAASLWDVGVSINRSNSLPLDKYTIFPTKALADAYASHNAKTLRDALVTYGLIETASGDEVANINADLLKAKFSNNSYPGQIVAVVTETTTTVYYIGADNLLHEVGGKIDIDGTTIKQDEDGKLYVDLAELGGVTEEKVLELIAAAGHSSSMVVKSVNTETGKYTVEIDGFDTEMDAIANVVYYVKDATASGDDQYKEYLLVGGILTLIGSTSTDLSNYYNKTEVDEKIKDFITLDDIPALNITGTAVDAGEGEVVLLADIAKSDAEGAGDHDLVKTYAVAATKDYVDLKVGEITIPNLEIEEDANVEVDINKDTVEVVSIEGLEATGHKLIYNKVSVATQKAVTDVADKVSALEGLKINETYATKEELKDHTDAADIEFAKLVGIGGTDEPATVVAAIDAVNVALDTRLKALEELDIALKSDIPEIPNLALIEDTTVSDVKIEVGEEGATQEVDGLVTVLRKIDVDGHTLTETRVALPTVAYIEDMIADVTGGESAGEVLAQLNNFKGEVASTYATKTELKVEADKLVGIGKVTEGEEQGEQPLTVMEAIADGIAEAKAYADQAAANATVKWEEME